MSSIEDPNNGETLALNILIEGAFQQLTIGVREHEFNVPGKILEQCVVNVEGKQQINFKLVKDKQNNVVGYQVLDKVGNPAFTL